MRVIAANRYSTTKVGGRSFLHRTAAATSSSPEIINADATVSRSKPGISGESEGKRWRRDMAPHPDGAKTLIPDYFVL